MPFDEEELDPHGECEAEIRRLRAVIYRLSEDVAFSPMNSSDMDEIKARLKYARENLDSPK